MDDEGLFRSIVDHLEELILVASAMDGRVIYANQAASHLLGKEIDPIAGRQLIELFRIAPDDAAGAADSKLRFVQLATEQNQSACEPSAVFTSRRMGDWIVVRSEKNAAQKAPRDASLDALTQLPDRASIVEMLRRQFLEEAANFALLFIDVDYFKNVNDRLGHLAGDAVLLEVARRLAQSLRGGDLIGRFGGDEFVAVLPRLSNQADADLVARRLRTAFAAPFEAAGESIRLSVSIGVTLSAEGYPNSQAMLHEADRRMYAEKDSRESGAND